MNYETFTVHTADGTEIIFEVPDTVTAPIFTYPAKSTDVDMLRGMLTQA